MARHRSRPPLTFRFLVHFQNAVLFFAGRLAAVLSVAMRLAVRDQEMRQICTAWIYNGRSGQLLDNRVASGLFVPEIEMISKADFPRSGTVLVAGAGGGREAVALSERGYAVVAFEPSPVVFEHLRTATATLGIVALRGSLEDLVEAAEHRSGPLAELRGQRFAAVVGLGGPLSYVLQGSERVKVLAATRRLAPQAPVLISFMSNAGRFPYRGRLGRLLRSLDSRRDAVDLVFDPANGFMRFLDDATVAKEAAEAGYRVACGSEEALAFSVAAGPAAPACAHTLLVPDDGQ